MKKIFTIIIAAAMAVSAWATDNNYSPTAEYNVRPKSDGTGYDTNNAAADQAAFEINHASRFCAIQQYKITSLADATSMTLALTNTGSNGSDALAIWAVPSSITWTSGMSASDFNSLYSTTTGMVPGVAGTASNTYLLQDATNVKDPSKFTFTGDQLTIIKNNAASDGTITLLITSRTSQMTTSGSKRQYQSSNSANANPPVLTVTTPSYVVTNLTTGTDYTDFATALSKAVANNVLQVNEDVTVTSRVENSVAITIQGKKGTEKILRGTGLNALVFLPFAALTLKDIIIDGQNIARTCGAVEVSKDNASLVMSNVTIQNFAGASTKILQVKKSCTVENCTFKDNTVAAGYGDIFVGTSDCLTLKGSNTIGNGIYVEKELYFNDGGTTHTSSIKVIADTGAETGRDIKGALGSNKAFIKGTVDTYKYTLSAAGKTWDIAGNESQNYIYVTKAASVTKTSDKTMSAGAGYKIGTVTIQ